jgi:hypothetical protein
VLNQRYAQKTGYASFIALQIEKDSAYAVLAVPILLFSWLKIRSVYTGEDAEYSDRLV